MAPGDTFKSVHFGPLYMSLPINYILVLMAEMIITTYFSCMQSKFVHGGVTESQQLLAHPAHGQTLSLRRQNFSLKRQKQSQCTKRQYTTATLIYKALSFNKDEWWIVVIGVIAAAISGLAFPALAVLFGEGFVVLTISYTQQLKYALPWALSFIALGIVVGIAFFVKVRRCNMH